MKVVELKVEELASQGFVQAVRRLAECRSLGVKDHKAVRTLAKTVQDKVNQVKELVEKNEKLDDAIAEVVRLEGCHITAHGCLKAALSPQDFMALGELVEE